ncbi:MAG: branched-chain amino acid ABC transporter permease [Chloroflexota bacterium]
MSDITPPVAIPAPARLLVPVVLAVVAGVGLVPLLTNDPALRETLFSLLMAITLATSVNIITGYTGYVSFGNIVFFGIGGYAAFWLMQFGGLNFVPAALLAIVPAVAMAVVVGGAVLRLRGAHFALATIGILAATSAFMSNFPPTGGAVGMFFDFSVYSVYGGARNAALLAYGAMLLTTLAAIATSYAVRRSRLGLALMTIREDEDEAMVLGINPPRLKVAAYALSALFPALAGAAFFFKNGVIEPGQAFDLTRSIESLVMVALGGLGTVAGPIIGAAAYDLLRSSLITSSSLADYQMSIAGLLLLVVILFATTGLVGWLRARWPRTRRWLE